MGRREGERRRWEPDRRKLRGAKEPVCVGHFAEPFSGARSCESRDWVSGGLAVSLGETRQGNANKPKGDGETEVIRERVEARSSSLEEAEMASKRRRGTQPLPSPVFSAPWSVFVLYQSPHVGQGPEVFPSASFRECERKQTRLEIKRPEFWPDAGHLYSAETPSFLSPESSSITEVAGVSFSVIL